MSSDITKAIDHNCYVHQEGARPHLGASQIGKTCIRELVYGFRQAVTVKHEGRMTRLFKRGHYEEPLVHAHLKGIGFFIRPFAQRLSYHPATGSYAAEEWDTPLWPGTEDVSTIAQHVWVAEKCAGIKLRQWNFKKYGGHFSGSNDGKIMLPSGSARSFVGIPNDVWILFENKTYNDKNYQKLVLCGQDPLMLQGFKQQHYDQMQIYMQEGSLPLALYTGVNKNDDDLHTIIVPFDAKAASEADARALATVTARQLPPRVSTYSGWHGCRFCDYRNPCHFGAALEKKCRTCTHVVAVDDARFHCAKFGALIPTEVEPAGCPSWETVTD